MKNIPSSYILVASKIYLLSPTVYVKINLSVVLLFKLALLFFHFIVAHRGLVPAWTDEGLNACRQHMQLVKLKCLAIRVQIWEEAIRMSWMIEGK